MQLRDPRQLGALQPTLWTVFGLVIAWLLYLSFAPVQFDGDWTSVLARLDEGLHQGVSERFKSHAVAMGGAGGLLGLAWRRPGRRSLLVVIAVGCFLLEISQAAFVHRHARLGDWVLNASAMSAGALLSRWPPLRVVLRAALRRMDQSLWRIVLLTLLVAAPAMLLRTYRGADLDAWDYRFPMAVGHDADGGRPFAGAVRRVTVFPCLVDTTAARLAEDPRWTVRELLGAGVGFALDDRTAPAHDRIGGWAGQLLLPGPQRRAPRELRGPASAPPGGNPTSRGHTSREPMCHLIYEAIQHDALSVELEVLHPERDAVQTPATVWSLGEHRHRYNINLLQHEQDLVLELRSALSLDPRVDQLRWRGVCTPDTRHHWLLTFDRGVVRLFRDGEPIPPTRSLLADRAAQRPGTAGGIWLLGALWFAPFGLALGRGFALIDRRLLAMAALCVVLALRWFETTLCSRIGHAPVWLTIAGTLAASACALAGLTMSRRRQWWAQ